MHALSYMVTIILQITNTYYSTLLKKVCFSFFTLYSDPTEYKNHDFKHTFDLGQIKCSLIFHLI